MAKTTSTVLSTNDATPRGQIAIVCRALQTPNGLTAQQLLSKTGGKTPWNSWSLQRVADRFGLRFVPMPAEKTGAKDGLMRYRFELPAKKAAAKKPTAVKAAANKIAAPRKVARKAKK
jgi:hypothetical protein